MLSGFGNQEITGGFLPEQFSAEEVEQKPKYNEPDHEWEMRKWARADSSPRVVRSQVLERAQTSLHCKPSCSFLSQNARTHLFWQAYA